MKIKTDGRESDFNALSGRFRGFYPVVIDVETAGFNANTDALLEIAAVTLKMDEDGWLQQDETLHFHVEPFEGANLQPEALAFNGIDPHNRCAARSANMTRCTPFSKRCAKGSGSRLQPGHYRGAQRQLRSQFPDGRGRARRPEAQPVPSVRHLRHRRAERCWAKRCWRKPASPPACRSTAARRTPPCTTPNKPPCCFASWLTAGNVSAAGRCPPPISPNKLNKRRPSLHWRRPLRDNRKPVD